MAPRLQGTPNQTKPNPPTPALFSGALSTPPPAPPPQTKPRLPLWSAHPEPGTRSQPYGRAAPPVPTTGPRCQHRLLLCPCHAPHLQVILETISRWVPQGGNGCPARYLCIKYPISCPKFILTLGSPPSRPHWTANLLCKARCISRNMRIQQHKMSPPPFPTTTLTIIIKLGAKDGPHS